MLRAIVLALILVVAFGTVVPMATEYAEAGASNQKMRKKKKKRLAKKYRKYITNRYTKRKKAKRYRKARKTRRYRASNRTRRARKTNRTRRYRKSNRTRRYRKTNRTRRYRKARRTRKSYRARKKSYRTRKTYRARKKSSRVRRKSYRKPRRYRSKKVRRSNVRRKARVGTTRRKARVGTTRRKARVRATAPQVRKPRRVRRYSQKWWRSYRAQQKRQKAIAERKRQMRLRRIRLTRQKQADQPIFKRMYERVQERTFAESGVVPVLPAAPETVPGPEIVDGDVSLDVIGPAVGETSLAGRHKTVGGVPTNTLRRTVIDRMIQENGWVENDFTSEIGGKKVYVVVAKSEDDNNRVRSQTFYFTESNGQIYRVSAQAPDESSEQVVKKSESVIRTLQKPEERVEQAQKQ